MLRVLLAAAILLASTAQDAQPARQLRALPPLPATQLDTRDTTLDSPRRLTLSFAEPRPIDEVLGLLMAGTRFSVSIDADATGAFRGELKQLTLREALTTMLPPLGLDFQVHGTVVRVRRRQIETRLFDLNLLNVQRGARVDLGAAGAPGAESGASVTTTTRAEDVLAGVADGVRTLLSETGVVHVDNRAGLAQVTDFPERLDRVALYIETLQQRTGRQVRLQAQAFEVTLGDGAPLDWRAVRARLGLPLDAPQAGLAADPAALRTALALQGDVRSLWAPDVTAMNNEPAMVRVSTPGGTSLTLTVVPQISADGIVQLSISHAWEERAGDHRSGAPASVTQSDTVTRVMDGNTVVISGLQRPQPAAGEAGGRLASLFGSRAKKAGHAELVVLLRPTVVTPGTFVAGNRN